MQVGNIHHQELSLRRNAHGVHLELLLRSLRHITCHNSGHMGAMGNTGVVAAKVSGGGAVAKAKGNLAAVVGVIRRDALGQRLRMKLMVGQDLLDVSLGECHGRLVGRIDGENRVVVEQAGVDDGHAHTGAIKAIVPGGGSTHAGSHVLHIGL